MWEKLRRQVWQWRGVLVAVPSVTAIVIGVRSMGLLQPIEFPVLDQFFLLRPAEPEDSRIVIVEVNESDVQKLGKWPMSDAELAKLLETLKRQQPVAIGLDLYRDLPVEPGHKALNQVFETTPNLIGVQKVSGIIDSSLVAPPPILKQKDQVGANDFPLDGDGKVRRGLLYLSDKDGNNVLSFAFMLAAQYLQKQNIQPEMTSDNMVKFGPTVFPAFNSSDGGYVGAQSGGYQVMLNYRGQIDRFQRVSLTDVLASRIPPNLMRDRIVLIGSTAESLKDLFYVPYSSSLTAATRMAGVAIHANLISQILSATLNDRPAALKVWSESLECLWIAGWALIGAILSWRQRYSSNKSRPWNAINVLLAGVGLVGGSYLAFLYGWWIPVVPPFVALIGAAIAITGYVARSAADMRRTFGRYLTDEVVASLLETPTGLTLGGERRKVTILISDLRGFSAISEYLSPEKVVTILNLYLGAMSDIIAHYNGTINEFIGDGIFVMFGAPVYRKDDSQRAIACAIAMQAAMDDVNKQNQQLDLPTIEMGIGINTGEVVVGNIGSQKRAKYTVIGNHANLAARIESYTVGRQILISQHTFQDAGAIVKVSGQIQVEPKGIKEPLTLYDVSGISGKYNIFLSKEVEEFVTLQSPVPVRYTVLEGKHLVGTVFEANIVKLSANGAELCSNYSLTPLSNLKIAISLPTSHLETEDLYAKVLPKPTDRAGCVQIRFTGMLPEVAAFLDQLRSTAKS